MRWGFLGAIAVLASGASLALAQPDSVPVGAACASDFAAEPSQVPGLCCCEPCTASCPPRLWASGEYLLWWTKDGSLHFPIVTYGDANVEDPFQAGALDAPGTVILYGPAALDYGTNSGLRLTLGGWLSDARCLGLEGRGFLLDKRSTIFRATGSAAPGSPVLAIPFFNTSLIPPLYLPGHIIGEDANEGSFPAGLIGGGASGTVVVSSTSRFWGAEVNGLVNGVRGGPVSLDLLVGFRYLDLDEGFRLWSTSALRFDFGNSDQAGLDDFGTQNQFYGGQLGARLGWQRERLTLGLSAKVALGSSHEVLNISGFNSRQNTSGVFLPSGVFPGFLFSEPTNIGRYARDRFSVVPEVEFGISYRLSQWLSASVGYNYLYWTDVLRPADQLNRVINGSQRGGFPLKGAPDPVPPTLNNTTDFWAHGLSFGLEFKY